MIIEKQATMLSQEKQQLLDKMLEKGTEYGECTKDMQAKQDMWEFAIFQLKCKKIKLFLDFLTNSHIYISEQIDKLLLEQRIRLLECSRVVDGLSLKLSHQKDMSLLILSQTNEMQQLLQKNPSATLLQHFWNESITNLKTTFEQQIRSYKAFQTNQEIKMEQEWQSHCKKIKEQADIFMQEFKNKEAEMAFFALCPKSFWIGLQNKQLHTCLENILPQVPSNIKIIALFNQCQEYGYLFLQIPPTKYVKESTRVDINSLIENVSQNNRDINNIAYLQFDREKYCTAMKRATEIVKGNIYQHNILLLVLDCFKPKTEEIFDQLRTPYIKWCPNRDKQLKKAKKNMVVLIKTILPNIWLESNNALNNNLPQKSEQKKNKPKPIAVNLNQKVPLGLIEIENYQGIQLEFQEQTIDWLNKISRQCTMLPHLLPPNQKLKYVGTNQGDDLNRKCCVGDNSKQCQKYQYQNKYQQCLCHMIDGISRNNKAPYIGFSNNNKKADDGY